jgi:PhzF family phenazine biosynthesis protein
MPLKVKFTTLDVFTSTPYRGNPLAIIHLPENTPDLPQAQKQLIAREFNLSETVFLHEKSKSTASNDLGQEPVVIDIFTPTAELPFAGHPTIGTSWYLLSQSHESPTATTLRTKAGDIPVLADPQANRVRAQVPLDFKIHPSYLHPDVKPAQAALTAGDYTNGLSGPEAVVSVVKGMTFMFVQLTSEDALARLQPFPRRVVMPSGYLGEWNGFVAVYAFYEREDGVVRTRMFDGTFEDPATGSAACTLAGWLVEKGGPGKRRVEIVQGVEMGRRSEIGVVVEVGRDGKVEKVELEGTAVTVMTGWIEI